VEHFQCGDPSSVAVRQTADPVEMPHGDWVQPGRGQACRDRASGLM
jgi:hypothetical protein